MSQTQTQLIESIRMMDPRGAAGRLTDLADQDIADILEKLNLRLAVEVLEEFESERRKRIASLTKNAIGEQWLVGHQYEEGTVARLMERPPAVFYPNDIVRDVIASVREKVKQTLITYIFITDSDNKLVGIVTFRELLFAAPEQSVEQVMVRNPFWLKPDAPVVDAMREVVTKHFPAYPVCKIDGSLVGMVRGQTLFEQQAFEISAQAGAMVGVEKEERLSTPLSLSFRFRNPWLLLNLLTAFVAAGVVGFFQSTINDIVLLAVFLPVLAGQSGNTGAQALAITIRGLTLGELRDQGASALIRKEALLGLMNGIVVGIITGLAMFIIAKSQANPDAFYLSIITWVSMTFSCMFSGMVGAIVPLVLRRLGTDPATASSIFLTTATDVGSMGVFLGLATIFLS